MKNIIGAIFLATALAACGGADKKTTHAKDEIVQTFNADDANSPNSEPNAAPGSPPTLDDIIYQGVYSHIGVGESKVFTYSVGGKSIEIMFVNDPSYGSLGGGGEGKIVLNIAQISLAYQMTVDILTAAGLQHEHIPAELFVKSILNQEIYHVEENGGDELASDIVSLNTLGAGDFYLLFRLSGTVSGAFGDPAGFNQWLTSGQVADPVGYKRLVDAYVKSVLFVDPNFSKNCPLSGDIMKNEGLLSAYLEKNPQFLSNVRVQMTQ